MKKFLGLSALLIAVGSLSACGSIPTCNENLDECNRGGAYTEERTAQADRRVAPPAPEPIVVPEPVPQPAPAPVVVEEPVPEPVVVDDTPVMTSAEPQFDQVSK